MRSGLKLQLDTADVAAKMARDHKQDLLAELGESMVHLQQAKDDYELALRENDSLRVKLGAEVAASSVMQETVTTALAEQEGEITQLQAGLEKVRGMLPQIRACAKDLAVDPRMAIWAATITRWAMTIAESLDLAGMGGEKS
jgi:hypothetical protein